MSRLINIDPQIQAEPELEGHEFGYYTFDSLPVLEIHNIQATQTTATPDDENHEIVCRLHKLPIDNNLLMELQQKMSFVKIYSIK